MKKKVAIHSLGCKLNQTEAMSMRYKLVKSGYEIVPINDSAHIFIINTCTVTSKSDTHARQFVRKIIKRNPDAFIIVTGCYPQINPEAFKNIAGVDLIIGNVEKKNILEFTQNADKREKPLVRISDISKKKTFDDAEYSTFGNYTRAFVKIQDGCDSACSFCIVRFARGPNRSAPPELILNRIENLARTGYKEIVLTGIHLGTYGNDFNGDWNLASLLREICLIKDLPQLRLSSIEPAEFTDDLIHTITSEPKIAKHFHIPLQSGSKEILRRMNRHYNPDLYRELVRKIKSLCPEASIGADVLIGFPGESDEDFAKTKGLIESTPLSYLHVFSYSKREGTPAAKMSNQIPPEVKKERSKILRMLGKRIWKEFCSEHIGRKEKFLILTSRDEKTGLLRGLSHNYLRILTEGDNSHMNQFRSIKILDFADNMLYGELDNP